jgi:hypothetical protein
MVSQNERNLVRNAYPSNAWKSKVDKMPDTQVLAILLRLRNQGKIRV